MITVQARRLLDACEAEVTAAVGAGPGLYGGASRTCLFYTSDAADDLPRADPATGRILKTNK